MPSGYSNKTGLPNFLGKKRGPQSPEHKAKTIVNLKPGYGKGMKFPKRSGEYNPRWKGDKAGYFTVHAWLKRHYGKANKCENPSCKKTSNTFHWSLLKGKTYVHNRENFWMLCSSCHALYDGFKGVNPEISKGNTYRRIDLTGQRFGKLRVVALAGRNKWGNLLFVCECDCENIKIVPSANLRDGRTQSCGCITLERMRGNQINKGRPAWNKGKKLHYEPWSKGKKGIHLSPNSEWKKGHIPWNKKGK